LGRSISAGTTFFGRFTPAIYLQEHRFSGFPDENAVAWS
jgi:hypothetical protein